MIIPLELSAMGIFPFHCFEEFVHVDTDMGPLTLTEHRLT